MFPPGLAEGAETIVVYSIVLVWPGWAEPAVWVWPAVVYLSVVQRIAFVRSRLASAVRP